jgi:uncharacterized protein YeaO (DUF488 family)
MVRIQRAYERAAAADGYRALVDRLWPRGVKKDALRLDLWAKDLAPSTALRRWFGHDPARFPEFARRYHAELRAPAARALLADLTRRAAHGTVTLVYGARDESHNGAVVLRSAIEDALREHAELEPRRAVSAARARPRAAGARARPRRRGARRTRRTGP